MGKTIIVCDECQEDEVEYHCTKCNQDLCGECASIEHPCIENEIQEMELKILEKYFEVVEK